MPNADYTRVSKNITFDELRTRFEDTDDQQVRVKHDWKPDGKVQLASKSGSEGSHRILSGRQKKFDKAEAFIVRAFTRSTGSPPSDSIRNMIKADQTAVENGKTIREMLSDVRTAWHREAVAKHTGTGQTNDFDVALQARSERLKLQPHQQRAVEANKSFLQASVKRAIEEKIAQSDGRTLSDEEIARIRDDALTKSLRFFKSLSANDAKTVGKTFSSMMTAKTPQAAAKFAETLVKGLLREKSGINSKVGELLFTALSLNDNLNEQGVHTASKAIGKSLLGRELQLASEKGSLLRDKTAYDEFTRPYFDQHFSSYKNGIQQSFQAKMKNIAMPGPMQYEDKGTKPPKPIVDHDIKRYFKNELDGQLERRGLVRNDPRIVKLEQERNRAVNESARCLVDVIVESEKDIPGPMKSYLQEMAQTASNQELTGHLSGSGSPPTGVMVNSFGLRYLNGFLSSDLGLRRQQAKSERNPETPISDFVPLTVGFDAVRVVNSVFNRLLREGNEVGQAVLDKEDSDIVHDVAQQGVPQLKSFIGKFTGRDAPQVQPNGPQINPNDPLPPQPRIQLPFRNVDSGILFINNYLDDVSRQGADISKEDRRAVQNLINRAQLASSLGDSMNFIEQAYQQALTAASNALTREDEESVRRD